MPHGRPRRLVGAALLVLLLAACAAEDDVLLVSHDDALVDPDAFHMDPGEVYPGDRIAARFAAGIERGPAFSLERRVDDGWQWEWAISNEVGATEVQVWTAQRFTENQVDWPAGPVVTSEAAHLLPIPRQAEPGTYRACTTGAEVTPRCASFEVSAPR